MLTLERLAFDSANPTDGPTLGSFLIGKAGQVVDTTEVSGVHGLNVNILNEIPVSLTQDDEVTVFQGTDPWLVQQSAATSSVAAWLSDGSGNAISSIGGALSVNSTPNTAVASAAVVVGTTEVALPGTALTARRYAMIQNNGNKSIFVGPTGVTTASGIEVGKGSTIALEAGASIALFGISTDAGQNVRVFELS